MGDAEWERQIDMAIEAQEELELEAPEDVPPTPLPEPAPVAPAPPLQAAANVGVVAAAIEAECADEALAIWAGTALWVMSSTR